MGGGRLVQIHPANGLCGCKAAIRHNTRKGPFSVSTPEVVVPFLNSFIASTVAVNQTPLSFYCPRSRSSRRSIVTTRGLTHSLLHARIRSFRSRSRLYPTSSIVVANNKLLFFLADDSRRKIEIFLDRTPWFVASTIRFAIGAS